MGLFSFLFGGGDKKTETNTTNTSQTAVTDSRVAASDYGVAVGAGGSLDASTSIDFADNSQRTDNSDNSIRIDDSRDQSDRRVFNIENSDPEVAGAAIIAARALGEGAFSLVSDGLTAQTASARENRLLAETAMGKLADTTRATFTDTLAALDSASARSYEFAGATTTGVLDLAKEIANRGQDESAAAREGANETIATVLASKESADTQISKDLIKWGSIALGVIFAALLFFGANNRRKSA